MRLLFYGILVLFSLILGGGYAHGQEFLFDSPGGFAVYHDPEAEALDGFGTDTSMRSIELKQVFDGGPGKDGIPALQSPKFIAASESTLKDDVLGIVVAFDGEARFYPYTILVWHEIVNDQINDHYFAVTFCPLCGTAIVYDRYVEGKLLEWRVSGKLFESNLLMYDLETESLWSQARGEGVVGAYAGKRMELVPMRLLEFGDVKKMYSNVKVLSKDTGYERDYSFYPYGNYAENEDVYFPVSVQDRRFSAKEIMYVFRQKNKSVAIPIQDVKEGEEYAQKFNEEKYIVTKQRGDIIVKNDAGVVPGYYEMWFSWAIHHEENGVLWEIVPLEESVAISVVDDINESLPTWLWVVGIVGAGLFFWLTLLQEKE